MTVCLLIGIIPLIQVEETMASENNITASINSCASQGGSNLLEVINKSVNQGSAISSIVIQSGVVTSSDFATIKSNNTNLRKLIIAPEVYNVTSVPSDLFQATAEKLNTTLTTVSLAQVNNIPANAFQYCTALQDVSLPNVISIGDSAFSGCISLLNLTLGVVPPTVGKNVFEACPINRTLYVPTQSIQSYKNANTTTSQFQDEMDQAIASVFSVTDNGSWNGFNIADISTRMTVAQDTTEQTLSDTQPVSQTPLNQANISIKAPIAGASMETFKAESFDGQTDILSTEWSDGANTLAVGNFAAKTIYTARVVLKPTYSTTFATDAIAKVNGDSATSVSLNESKTEMTVTKKFTQTGPAVSGINVHVKDKDTDKPISGALVYFPDVNITGKTNTDGYTTVSDFSTAKDYTIVVSATGYLSQEQTVSYSSGIVVVTVALSQSNIKQVVIEPKTADVEKGKERQFTATVLTATGNSASGVNWSLEGDHHADTRINSFGLLKVSYDEIAKDVTVVATSLLDGITTAKVKVTLKDVPPSTLIKSPVTIPVQTPVTGEQVSTEITTKEYNGKVTWTPDLDNGAFVPLKKYTAKVVVKANRGYRFDKDTLVSVTDSDRVYDILVDKSNSENTLSFKVAFPSTYHPDYATQKAFDFAGAIPTVKTYGDRDFVIYARGGTGTGEITYKSSNASVLQVLNDKDAATVKIISAGSAKIIATKAGSVVDEVSYNPISISTNEIIVSPKKLIAKAKDITIHEESTPKFEVVVTGFANNDSEALLKSKGYQAPVASSSDTKIGNYPIKVSGGSPTKNYEFDYVEGKIKIVSKDTDLSSTSDKSSPDILVSKDLANEVSVEKLQGDMFKEGTVLSVKDITKNIDERDKRVYDKNIMVASKGKELALLYDITLLLDKKAIQPDGTVKVTIEIPQEIRDKYRDFEVVYIDEYGKVTLLDSELSYNKISFKTTHFSKYAIIGTAKTVSNNPQTGDKAFNMIFVVLGLIALGVLMFVPKKSSKVE